MRPARPAGDAVTLRVAAALAVALAVLAAIELMPAWQRPFAPLGVALAAATEWILTGLGLEVARDGAVLVHPEGFAYRITYVCSGFRPAVIIVAVLLALPMAWHVRLAGIVAGVAGVEVVNLLRLAHLYWTGVFDPASFEMAHRLGWNVVAIAMVAAYLLPWIRRHRSPGPAPAHALPGTIG